MKRSFWKTLLTFVVSAVLATAIGAVAYADTVRRPQLADENSPNYVTLSFEYYDDVDENIITNTNNAINGKKYASLEDAETAYLGVYGVTWDKGYLDVTDNTAPLFSYIKEPIIKKATFTVHGTVGGFGSINSNQNQIDCTFGGNHQIRRTSFDVVGSDGADGSKAKVTSGNIVAQIAGGYSDAFNSEGKLTVSNIEFTSTETIVISASADVGTDVIQNVTSAELEIKNCAFHGQLYLYSNFKNNDTMIYKVHDNIFSGNTSYGIFVQPGGNDPVGPKDLYIQNNAFSGYQNAGINMQNSNTNLIVSGNTISISDATRSDIQLTNFKSADIYENTLYVRGNAFTLHDNLAAQAGKGVTLNIHDNVIKREEGYDGDIYLFYDGIMTEKAAGDYTDNTYYTLNFANNTVDEDIITDRGVKKIKTILDTNIHKISTYLHNQIHQLKHVGEVKPTCTESGNKEYWTCHECGKLYADAEGKTIIPNKDDVILVQTGHTLTKVPAKMATCTENGIVEHWSCAACHKNFSDDKATTVIPDVTDKAPGHDLKLVEAVKATTESEGSLAYYICNRCGRWFWDSKGENPVESKEAIVTAKLTETTKDLQDKGTSITVENKAEGTVKETVSDQKAAQLAANSVVVENKDSLVDNVAKVAQAISNDETVKAAAKAELEKHGADLTNNKMELVVKPYPVVTITDDTEGVLSLEIALFRSVEAVAGDVRVPLPEETKKIDNEDITQPTKISMEIPEAYKGAKYIRHTLSNGRVKYYPVTTQNNVITFEVPAEDGFSPFVLIAEDATVTVKLDGETKTYNRTDVVNETALPTLSKNNYNFKGWKFDGVDGQRFNMTAELFEALLANHADTTAVNAASVFEGPLSEHPEIEEAKKNGTWGVDENKPAATAKPASAAAAVTPVRSSIPKTSDDSNLMLWVCLMGLAALGLGGAVYMKKRNHQ